ncbi:DUF7331 family protein [Halolamina salifodinae]|uniref:Uncharacterized protein n=1 Tax=Halolamina salifodinae TaxID=1202767 RepID=A0A8T4GT32_9EURY|nr:hypothetical protein [Halolamina salifodinae]MBP1985560.1 hypothetical protein [Halolamina salifodinae]
MPDESGLTEAASERPGPADDGFDTVESYEVDGGVVLYDAEAPLAWIRSDTTTRLNDRC